MTARLVLTNYSGLLYRCIPHTATDPLSAEYARQRGGRWNAPAEFPVLYTFLSPEMARRWLSFLYAQSGLRLDEVQPEQLPDLVILRAAIDGIVDITTELGLAAVGLPPEYPDGFRSEAAYPVTQTIGRALNVAGYPGIITRSAAALTIAGPMEAWAELALFTEHASSPTIVDRQRYADWLP